MFFQKNKPMLWGAKVTNEHRTMPIEWALLTALACIVMISYGFTLIPEHHKEKITKKITVVDLKKIVKEKPKPAPPKPKSKPKPKPKPKNKPKPKKVVKPKPQPKPVVEKPVVKPLPIEPVVDPLPPIPVVEETPITPIPDEALTTEPEPAIVEQQADSSNEQPIQTKSEIGVVCSKQVKPKLSKRQLRKQVPGEVDVEVTIENGKVVVINVIKSVPNGMYDKVVKQALMKYDCDLLPNKVTATRKFYFQF